MADLTLWKQLESWKKEYEWVDLSHELSPETPHWVGFNAMQAETFMDLDTSLFCVHTYTTVGQYGTHIDVGSHMVDGGRSLEQYRPDDMVLPLCVIDKTREVAENVDYAMTVNDILEWEKNYGTIPAGAFVVFQSGWSKRSADAYDNLDEAGNRRFPGWSLESLQFLIEQRNISGVGHETSDTEAPATSTASNYEVEYYLLAQGRFQIELLTNIEKCPPVGAVIFCTFPKVKHGTGFPARCFALCPRSF